GVMIYTTNCSASQTNNLKTTLKTNDMINEDEKKQQPDEQDFSIENFLTDEKKQPLTEQQIVTHRDNFTRPETDKEALMQGITRKEPAEAERTKSSVTTTKRTASKLKKIIKEDYCEQFF